MGLIEYCEENANVVIVTQTQKLMLVHSNGPFRTSTVRYTTSGEASLVVVCCINQDTDRLICRLLAIGVQGLPSKDYYLLQEPIEELLKAALYVRKQWLASAQLARERQKRRVAEQTEKCPEECQFMTNWLLQGTGYPALGIYNRLLSSAFSASSCLISSKAFSMSMAC
jgi:hypothetical protein